MTDPARALGLGSTLTHEGVTYRVAPWRFGVQAAYSQFLTQKAVEALDAFREFLPPQEYRDFKKDVITKDRVNGTYAFGSETVMESLQVKDQLAYLLWLQLREPDLGNPPVGLDLARRMTQDDPEAVLKAVTEANLDPTKAPAATAPPAGATPSPSNSSAPS